MSGLHPAAGLCRRRAWRVWAAIVGLVLAAAPARALVSCTTAASGVNFGVYNPLATTATLANGTLSVTCNLLSGGATSVPITVSLSAGLSGSYATRTLQAGSNALNYNLFWSTAYTQIWGDGTGGSFYGGATVFLSPGSPVQTVSGTMYGRMPAGQDVGAGSYLDTIVITVTY